jgi:hypothetical protein
LGNVGNVFVRIETNLSISVFADNSETFTRINESAAAIQPPEEDDDEDNQGEGDNPKSEMSDDFESSPYEQRGQDHRSKRSLAAQRSRCSGLEDQVGDQPMVKSASATAR